MTYTDPAPRRASTPTVKRLNAVASHLASSCGVSEVHPADVERVLNFLGIRKTVGRGQPHHLYGTQAVSLADFDRITNTDPQVLRNLVTVTR